MPMFDDPKVSLPDRFTRSYGPPDGVVADTSPTLERGGLVDSQVVEGEVLIIDHRSAISPAQMVENKLTRIFKDASLPVSHLPMRSILRSR